jgi:hypothetical protein
LVAVFQKRAALNISGTFSDPPVLFHYSLVWCFAEKVNGKNSLNIPFGNHRTCCENVSLQIGVLELGFLDTLHIYVSHQVM